MITSQQIRDVYEKASSEFAASASYRHLLGGQADADEVRDFIRNEFLTHYLSSYIWELCLAVLLETVSFEFMLSRCSEPIAAALLSHYALPKRALQWFELHSDVDIRHAEEGLQVVLDYLNFHQITDSSFEHILHATFRG